MDKIKNLSSLHGDEVNEEIMRYIYKALRQSHLPMPPPIADCFGVVQTPSPPILRDVQKDCTIRQGEGLEDRSFKEGDRVFANFRGAYKRVRRALHHIATSCLASTLRCS